MIAVGCGAGTSPEPQTATPPVVVESAQEPEATEGAQEPTGNQQTPELGEDVAVRPVPGPSVESEPSAPPPPPPPPPEPARPSDVPGANMHIQTVTINGVTVQDVECRTQGGGLGGLLGTMTVGKPFADKKAALDRCVQGRQLVRVRWEGVGGKMTKVTVLSTPDNACVVRTLNGAASTIEGVCAASIELGK